jgi:hypothetical protein
MLRQHNFNQKTKSIGMTIEFKRNIKLGRFKPCLLLFLIFLTVITLPIGIQAQTNGQAYAQTEGEIEDNQDTKSKNSDKRVDPFTNTHNLINSISASASEVSASSSSKEHGDFNGDGFDDLAVGVPEEDVGSIENAGGVEVIYGSSSGLSATATRSDQFWTQDSADIDNSSEFADKFGTTLG